MGQCFHKQRKQKSPQNIFLRESIPLLSKQNKLCSLPLPKATSDRLGGQGVTDSLLPRNIIFPLIISNIWEDTLRLF